MNHQERKREWDHSYFEVGEVVEADVVEGDDDRAGVVALPGHPQHGVRCGDLVKLVVRVAIWGEEKCQDLSLGSPLEVRDSDVATPALVCHKNTAQGTQSPLLGWRISCFFLWLYGTKVDINALQPNYTAGICSLQCNKYGDDTDHWRTLETTFPVWLRCHWPEINNKQSLVLTPAIRLFGEGEGGEDELTAVLPWHLSVAVSSAVSQSQVQTVSPLTTCPAVYRLVYTTSTTSSCSTDVFTSNQ